MSRQTTDDTDNTDKREEKNDVLLPARGASEGSWKTFCWRSGLV
jgi:hypothetical protein